jgi:hypothetical protein
VSDPPAAKPRVRFGLRLLGTARLDAHAFEEIEADPRSLAQAALVVALACAAIGFATAVDGARAGLEPARLGFQIAVHALVPALGWLGGSAFAYMVGASFLRGPHTATDYREVLRTTGFALGPGILRAFACAPPPALGLAVDLVATLWMLVAGVVAVRQALDFSTRAAAVTCGAAGVLLWLVVWGLSVAPLPI